jgi:hypothetical protein
MRVEIRDASHAKSLTRNAISFKFHESCGDLLCAIQVSASNGNYFLRWEQELPGYAVGYLRSMKFTVMQLLGGVTIIKWEEEEK